MDKNMDTSIKRINLKLPAYVQDYYKEMGDKYNIPYSNYITMILVQWYEQEMDKRMLNELNSSLVVFKEALGDNPKVVMADSRQMIEEVKSLAEKLGK